MALGYLRNPSNLGWQPPHRATSKRPGAGRLRFHAIGCTADGGGGLHRGVCAKCQEAAPDAYRQLLKRLDQRSS